MHVGHSGPCISATDWSDLVSDKFGQHWHTPGLGHWTGTQLVLSSKELSARHSALPPARAENTMEAEMASPTADMALSGLLREAEAT